LTTNDLFVVVSDGVARLTLNRPAKRNAVTFEMWNGIDRICHELADDDAVKLLVISGTGNHFCAGADVTGMDEVSAAEYGAANESADRAISAFPKPSVAFITGSCIGGGSQIATACDMRIADTTARFGITPARLGILYPAVAVERTVHTIGPSATKHLLYSAEIISAERALRIGLVDEVLEPPEAAQRLDQLATLLVSERSLFTQMASKDMVDDVVRNGSISAETVARWHEERARSDDAQEGISAFIERRQPQFTWRPGRQT
jgi:enoyl-CoA hydratase/carnithine racemase